MRFWDLAIVQLDEYGVNQDSKYLVNFRFLACSNDLMKIYKNFNDTMI